MFKTVQDSAVLEAGPRGRDGVQLWLHVETEIWPWFYIEVVQSQGTKKYRTMLMLPNIAELANVLASQTSRVKVEQVYLLTPATFNQTTGWQMEGLSKIEIGKASKNLFDHVYCTVENGGRYSLSDTSGELYSPALKTIFQK